MEMFGGGSIGPQASGKKVVQSIDWQNVEAEVAKAEQLGAKVGPGEVQPLRAFQVFLSSIPIGQYVVKFSRVFGKENFVNTPVYIGSMRDMIGLGNTLRDKNVDFQAPVPLLGGVSAWVDISIEKKFIIGYPVGGISTRPSLDDTKHWVLYMKETAHGKLMPMMMELGDWARAKFCPCTTNGETLTRSSQLLQFQDRLRYKLRQNPPEEQLTKEDRRMTVAYIDWKDWKVEFLARSVDRDDKRGSAYTNLVPKEDVTPWLESLLSGAEAGRIDSEVTMVYGEDGTKGQGQPSKCLGLSSFFDMVTCHMTGCIR
jgi:hypothetical protein